MMNRLFFLFIVYATFLVACGQVDHAKKSETHGHDNPASAVKATILVKGEIARTRKIGPYFAMPHPDCMDKNAKARNTLVMNYEDFWWSYIPGNVPEELFGYDKDDTIDTGSDYEKGKIIKVIVYRNAITEDEIDQLIEKGLPPSTFNFKNTISLSQVQQLYPPDNPQNIVYRYVGYYDALVYLNEVIVGAYAYERASHLLLTKFQLKDMFCNVQR